MIVCTCDHCGRELKQGDFRLELRDYPIREGRPVPDDLVADFCGMPCLLGHALTLAARYGFEKRVPPRKAEP